MIEEKEYTNPEVDNELLYLISDNNEDANSILQKKYDPVISYYANKYSKLVEGKGIDYNDLYQEGLIGLINAVEGFKNQKDIRFSTFAFLCIKRSIISAVRNASRKKHKALNESYSLDYESKIGEQSFDNIVSDSNGGLEDLLVSKENNELFNEKLSSSLTSLEKQVYELRINNFSYEEIASMLGKTKKAIDGALVRIRIKLRKILDEINWLF